MPKMLSEENWKLLWVPDGGIADLLNPTVDELTDAAVVDFSCLVTKANFSLGPTGDESLSDPALCAKGNSQAPGNTNYEAAMDFFRWTTTPEDDAWTTFTDKGIGGFWVTRVGKLYSLPIIATDVVNIYGVITGTPRNLAPDAAGGFQKFHLDCFVQGEQVEERIIVDA